MERIDNRHQWPAPDQYAIAQHCPRCKANPGEPCSGPRYHAQRGNAGIRHYNRDIREAPWSEDREPGRCYCTINPCPSNQE